MPPINTRINTNNDGRPVCPDCGEPIYSLRIEQECNEISYLSVETEERDDFNYDNYGDCSYFCSECNYSFDHTEYEEILRITSDREQTNYSHPSPLSTAKKIETRNTISQEIEDKNNFRYIPSHLTCPKCHINILNVHNEKELSCICGEILKNNP